MLKYPNRDILYVTNLRKALEEYYANINLEVVRQGLITTADNENIFQRVVNIQSDNITLVHATTSMCLNTYQYFKTELDNLSTNFIGDNLLYKLPFKRSPFYFKEYNSNIERSSNFNFNNMQISLSELFYCI